MPYAVAPSNGSSTRNQSALMRARAAPARVAPTHGAQTHARTAQSMALLDGPRKPSRPPSRWVGEIADASVSNSWAALLPGGPADDHAAALVEAPSGKLYAGRSLWGMLPAHEPRRSAIRLIELRWFDMVILLTIGANCATMAWESPLDAMLHPEGTWKSDFIDVCEWVYLGIFTFELLTKVLAYGFLWHPEAYLRDAWCQLDFVVVTLAWAPILFPAMGNYSVIRSFRALRPLRALKRMPGMPKLAAAACCKRRPAPRLASAPPGLRPAWPPPSLASVDPVLLAAGLGLGLRAARGSRQERMGRTGRTGRREGRGAAVGPARDRRRPGAPVARR